MNRVFDRRVSYDEKSLNYPIRTLLPDKPLRSFSWRAIQLDQGEEGACTGFSATMEAAARPVPIFGNPIMFGYGRDVSNLNQIGVEVYHRARQLDEWEGEDYEGSSVIAATKAGMERGWWKEYRWALGPGPEAAAEDVMRAVSFHGPVMLGTNWYYDMMEADSKGFLHATGGIAGGHAFIVNRYSVKGDAVWTPNSWGGFGQGWISRADLITLLANDGEACIPVMRTFPTVKK